jgi:DNA cross-link repair 1C protein
MYVEVTTIPAGHCFGSIMFLFKTPSKTVLFTGDFRIGINDASKLGHLHTKRDPIVIDKMYADTTFLNASYEHFPKRSDSVEHAIAEIKTWLDCGADNLVALHPSARFGYEYVFNEIYKTLGMKVYIGELDWHLYRYVLNK